MAKFTCPYCMKDYSLRKALYVCPDCGETATPKMFEREPIKCKKSGCRGLATQRKCPYCGETLPRIALQTPNLPFSIIGVSNSGKTNYITVMLHEISRAPGLRLALGHQNQATLDHQNENYRRIYEDHSPPGSTAGGERMPQIWYIKNLLKKRGNNVPTYTFTIFDGAGEDHEHGLDDSSPVCQYIRASKAIIITLDPLILDAVKKGGIVNEDDMRNSLAGNENVHKNAVDVVNSLANYIKSTGKKGNVNKTEKRPIAVVLTKFDTVKNDFSENDVIRSSSMNVRDGKISLEEIDQVDEEIRNWLEKIGERPFIDALHAHFENYKFFGVSSYGKPPTGVATLSEKITPHRVLDPILWLFKKNKFVD